MQSDFPPAPRRYAVQRTLTLEPRKALFNRLSLEVQGHIRRPWPYQKEVVVDRRMVYVATARLWRDPISEPADGELSLRSPLALA